MQFSVVFLEWKEIFSELSEQGFRIENRPLRMVLCIPARLALVVAVWVQAAVARSISEPHGDPSGSWLSYAEFAAGRKITGMNATVVVPSTPTNTRMGSNP